MKIVLLSKISAPCSIGLGGLMKSHFINNRPTNNSLLTNYLDTHQFYRHQNVGSEHESTLFWWLFPCQRRIMFLPEPAFPRSFPYGQCHLSWRPEGQLITVSLKNCELRLKHWEALWMKPERYESREGTENSTIYTPDQLKRLPQFCFVSS